MTEHDLKCWPEFFHDLATGQKTFELRKNDRGYGVGDLLRLREWDPETKIYTGRETTRRVTHMLEHRQGAECAADFGLKDGYAILSLGDQ